MISSNKPRLEKSKTAKSPSSLPPSPNNNHPISPNRNHKSKPSSLKKKGLLHGVWPSSSTPKLSKSTSSHNENAQTGGATTLADYLGNDRKRDKNVGLAFLSKQRSCSEFDRFENNSKKQNNLKENHKPIFGSRSMRYTGKFRFPRRSSTSSPSLSSNGARDELVIMPGRLSVDGNELRRRSYSRTRSDSFSDDSESSDTGSPLVLEKNCLASYMAPTFSSRRYISNSPTKSIINSMKKADSLVLPSKWGSMSRRSYSPPMMMKNSSFSTSKPPTSPSRIAKKNFLHMGLDLIKNRKHGSGCLSPLGVGMSMVENVHQLRVMHGSWMQWRYANAKAYVVNETLDYKAKTDSLHAWENLVKLQQSVLQKRLKLEKEKLEMKLNFILHSQMKMLESWRDMEMRHASNVSTTKYCLEAVVCRAPLIEGAKMDPQTTTIALGHATDLVASVMSMMSSMLPLAPHTTLSPFSELAKVAIEEKLLLEECFEHFAVISRLEIEERSLRCTILGISFEDQQFQPREPCIVVDKKRYDHFQKNKKL